MKIVPAEPGWSIEVRGELNRLRHSYRHCVRVCRILFCRQQNLFYALGIALEASSKLRVRRFNHKTQLLCELVSFRSEMFEQLNEAVLLPIRLNGQSIPSQYVHISHFAGSLSDIFQASQ